MVDSIVKTNSQKRANMVNKLNLPTYTSSDSGTNKNQLGGNFQQTITDDELMYLTERDEVANKIVNRPPHDALKRGFRITSENEGFEDKANNLIQDTKFINSYIQSWSYARMLGYSPLILGLEDTADLDKEPENVKGIKHLTAITKDQVEKINIDKYGEIESYNIKYTIDNVNERKTVHASRVIHVVDATHLGDYHGMSKLVPLFDQFQIKKNMELGMGHAIYRFASPISTLYLPDDADEDEFEEVSKTYYLEDRNEFVFPTSYRLEFHNSKYALDPSPYIEKMWQSMAAGSEFDKVTLMGSQEGSVTGSWVNQANYFGEIADAQKLKCEPVIREFISKMQSWNILPEAEYEITWPTLWELDEKNKSEMDKNLAQSELYKVSALEKYKNIGYEPAFDEDGWYVEQNGTKDRLFDTTKVKIQTKSNKLKKSNEDKIKYTPEELKKLRKKYEINTTLIEEESKTDLMREIIKITTNLKNKLTNIYKDENPEVKANIINKILKTKQKTCDTDSFIDRTMKELKINNVKELKKISVSTMSDAYKVGALKTETMEHINALTPLEQAQDIPAEVLSYFNNRADIHWDNKSSITTAELRRSIMEGINQGETQSQLEARVTKIVPNALRPDVFVNTEVHIAVEKGRLDIYKKMGIETVTILTMGDDRVRDEHSALEGVRMTRAEAEAIMSEPNCRCTSLPIRGV